jgi:formylmethanofuran dehydrogenase subunit E
MKRAINILFFFFIAAYGFPQMPSIKVIDTDFSKGRLNHQQAITLDDAARFHGHLCDGLVVGFLGLGEALYKLYPDSIIDRTNTRIVSKSSPCLTDIAIYLTGGRYQFNSFYVSDSIIYAFIVQRIDNSKTYGVKLKPGIKPPAIDSLGNIANRGKLNPCSIDSLKKMENRFLEQLLASNPRDLFIVDQISNYRWNPVLSGSFLKTDIVNKGIPDCLPVKK